MRCRRKPYTSLNIFLLMFKIRSRFLLASGLILSLENDFHVWCIKTKNILISIRYTPCSVFNCFSLLKNIHVVYYYMQDADFMPVYCGVFQVINFICFLKACIVILPCYVITVVCWTYKMYIHIYVLQTLSLWLLLYVGYVCVFKIFLCN